MTTVRLDPSSEATLRRLALRRGQTKSEVIRDAVARLADEAIGTSTALDRLRPYVGVVDLGGLDLSRATGRKFRQLLLEKRRARRSG
jgi:Arc/MetJ-type ribon-helix-helix transcriptional regulator